MASVHSTATLREIVETRSGKPHHLFVRLALPHVTLLLLTPPDERQPLLGCLRSFKGDLSVSMHPPSLHSSLKHGWLPRVSEALLGVENTDKYTFSLSVESIEPPPAAASAAADEPSASGSKRNSARRTPAGVATTRVELKVSYKGGTLVRFPLSNWDASSASSGLSAPMASLASASPFVAYRQSTLQLLERVAVLTGELQQRISVREVQKAQAAAKLKEQLATIQTKAIQKSWMEEGVLAQLSVLLGTKDDEIKRLTQEKLALHAEVATLQLRSQLSELGDSSSSMLSEEEDLARMAQVVDDEEARDRGRDSGDSQDEEEDQDEEKSGSETEAKTKKATKGRASAAAASKAKPKAKAAPKSRKKPAAAAAAEDDSEEKKAPARKARAPAKPRAKKDSAKKESAAAAASPDSKLKRARKRVRSPSPVAEGDDDVEIVDGKGKHEDDDSAAAVAEVEAYERAQAAAGSKSNVAAAAPSPALAADAAASAAPRRTRSSFGTAAAAALPLASQLRPPPPFTADSADDSPLDLSTSTPVSQQLAFDAGQSRKKRAVSPPPRVLPKRSLAQILRDGAAGMVELDDDEEATPASRPASQAAAAAAAAPPASLSLALAPPSASLPRASRAVRASLADGPVGMDLSSQ